MRVRAYDPAIGRFISHDPLGRASLFFSDQPYAYAGANPVSNVDPSGQHMAGASNRQTKQAATKQASKYRVNRRRGCDGVCRASTIADDAAYYFNTLGFHLALLGFAIGVIGIALNVTGLLAPPSAPVTEPIGLYLDGMALIIGAIGTNAYWLGNTFSWNASWPSESSRWANRSALEAMRRRIHNTINF